MGETIDKVLETATMDTLDHAQIRAAVKEAQDEEKCSQVSIARRAGIKESTISAYMTANYSGRNDPIGKQLMAWLRGRKAQASVRSSVPVQTNFVMTPTAENFMALLQRAQYEPAMVTLTGEPGVGKTEALREYKRRHPNVHVLTASKTISSAYGLLDYLCDVLGIPEGNASRRTRVIMQALRHTGALLVVDEAQHLQIEAIDELRVFHDAADVQVGIALVGSPDLRRRMLNGGKRGAFAQLTSRFGAHVVRKSPLPADVAAILDAECIEGRDECQLLRAIAQTPGALREMKFVMRSAKMIAQDSECDSVAVEHIEQAIRQRNSELKEVL